MSALLAGKPRERGVVVRGHRPAHGHDRVESAPVGERLALVELHAMQLRTALAEHVLEHARRLAGDVLEDQRLHAGETSGRGLTPCTCVPTSCQLRDSASRRSVPALP